MKQIYQKIWELARPYYEKSRPMDIDHVEWMMQAAETVCENENVDDSLLLPLVILHDVGYAETGPVYFDKNLKQAHMDAGAKMARRILAEVGYPEDKIEKIASYILVHDRWIFGDHDVYKNDLVLGAFNDLDFMSMAAAKCFPHVMKNLKKNPKEMVEFIESSEKLVNRPFATKTTEQLFEKHLNERKKEILN